MELHSCTNCELIDEVIRNEVQKFDILTKENVTLHSDLINARKTIANLESEILNLHKVVAAERQHNLHVYLQQQSPYKESQPAMNVIINPDIKRTPNRSRPNSARKINGKSSASSVQEKNKDDDLLAYNVLKSFCKQQEEMYEENLLLLQIANDNCLLKIKEQFSNMQDHLTKALEMYATYRSELFRQKKKNSEEHQTFLKTINVLRKSNTKHVQEVVRKLSTENISIINEQIKEISNAFHHEIDKRDKLVNVLRRQQGALELQLEEFKKQGTQKQQQLKRIIDETKKQLKHSQEKYSILEKRRAFDAEGFRTDINDIRKNLTRVKNNLLKEDTGTTPDFLFGHKKLEKKIDELDRKFHSCYIRSK